MVRSTIEDLGSASTVPLLVAREDFFRAFDVRGGRLGKTPTAPPRRAVDLCGGRLGSGRGFGS